jgi:hypothetical protein
VENGLDPNRLSADGDWAMKKLFLALIGSVLLVVLLPIVLRREAIPLQSHGKTMAVAWRPFALPWKETELEVFQGKTKVFGIPGDAYGYPVFIHPFPDGRRFLCVDDDDTAILVYLVDLNLTNSGASFGWPPDGYAREYLARRATNVVLLTNGGVRLPTFDEVAEVSSDLIGMSSAEFEHASLPVLDLGVWRGYGPKEILLLDLDTNRRSLWPVR